MSAIQDARPTASDAGRQACIEAERLAVQAASEAARLRAARAERAALERELQGGLALADRRALAETKLDALARYRRSVEEARGPGEVMAAVASWLSEIDRLNRAAALAADAVPAASARLGEATALVERLDVSAEAARVAAAIARHACLEARGALAGGGQPPEVAAPSQPPGDPAPLAALLAGDRAAVTVIATRLATETECDANRIQLLLLELREALIERACDEGVLSFPAGHPFWGQFERAEARAVAAALAVVGRGCDGRGGWRGGWPAEPRELAIALSLAGLDPRTVRTRPTRAQLERLWQGTTVAVIDHLRDRAPDLGLESLGALLGPRAEPLAELWNDWARLRPLLLGATW